MLPETGTGPGSDRAGHRGAEPNNDDATPSLAAELLRLALGLGRFTWLVNLAFGRVIVLVPAHDDRLLQGLAWRAVLASALGAPPQFVLSAVILLGTVLSIGPVRSAWFGSIVPLALGQALVPPGTARRRRFRPAADG